MPKHLPARDSIDLLQNAIDALLVKGMARFTLRATAILLECYTAPKHLRTMVRIAETLEISQSATSLAIQRLVDVEGLLERTPDKTDGRVNFLRPTPRGRFLCRDLVRASKAR